MYDAVGFFKKFSLMQHFGWSIMWERMLRVLIFFGGGGGFAGYLISGGQNAIIVGVVVGMIVGVLLHVAVPKPVGQIKQKFLAEKPGSKIDHISIIADEAERMVAVIFYGSTRPPKFILYAVNKTTRKIEVLPDSETSTYLPSMR